MATTSIMPLHTGKGRTMERTLLAAQTKNTHRARWVFLFWWASQDLNPGPSGYEKVHCAEMLFFLCNNYKLHVVLLTILHII